MLVSDRWPKRLLLALLLLLSLLSDKASAALDRLL
jgi:hypothetical protein